MDSVRYASMVHGGLVVAANPSTYSWTLPPWFCEGNTDAYLADGGGVGLGAVVRSAEGVVLAVGTRKGLRGYSMEMVEVAAAGFRLELVSQTGWKKVVLEFDAENVVRNINKRSHVYALVFLFYDEIARARCFESSRCSYVKIRGIL